MEIPRSKISWQEVLKFINKCPVCGSEYKTEQAKVFVEHSAANLVHIKCSKCYSNFIALVITMNQAISTVGMMSDLTLSDAQKMNFFEPISIDELIEGRLLVNTKSFKFFS